MASGDYIEDLIEKYIRGKLDEGARAAFEKEMDRDPELRKKIEEEKLLMGAVVHARKQELKDYIKTETRREKRKKDNRTMLISLAASAILAVGAGFYVYVHENMYRSESKADTVSKVQTDSTRKDIAMQNADSLPPANAPKLPETATANSREVEKDNTVQNSVPPKLAFSQPDVVLGKPSANAPTMNDERVYSNRSVLSGEANQSMDSARAAQGGKTTLADKYTDTIRGDVHIKDSSIAIRIVAERNARAADTAADASMKVSYWNSPLHFKGYRYYIKELSLYGVSTHARISVTLYQGIYYLKIAGKYYRLTGEDYVYDFSNPVTNTRILNALKNDD